MKKIKAGFIEFRFRVVALAATALWITLNLPAARSLDQLTRPAAAQISSESAPANAAIEIKMDNFSFSPSILKVKVGERVTWINKDDIPHTVDSTEGKFKSAALDTDDKFQFVFTAPGEYPFYCRMHPKMTGKVVVGP